MGCLCPTHEKGEKVSGNIKSITDFGIFIGLEGGIDGLVHLSDISWNETGEEACVVTRRAMPWKPPSWPWTPKRKRISLGIKQLERDPFGDFVGRHDKGVIVKGKVKTVDAKGATIEVMDGVEASLRLPKSAVTAWKMRPSTWPWARKSKPRSSALIASPASSACRSRPRTKWKSAKQWPRCATRNRKLLVPRPSATCSRPPRQPKATKSKDAGCTKKPRSAGLFHWRTQKARNDMIPVCHVPLFVFRISLLHQILPSFSKKPL
jgi:hypothetical protein